MKFEIDADAFLMFSESSHNADMYYATRFLAYDDFIYLNTRSERLVVSDMELERAKKESSVKNIISASKFGLMEKIREYKDVDIAYCKTIIEMLQSENLKRIAVPNNFPLQQADRMRMEGFEVIPMKSPFREMREVKNEHEVLAIEKAQRAGERALAEGISIIKKADIRYGILWHEDSPLTAEKLRAIIERSLLSQGCESADTIIASGKGSSDPHWGGEGQLQVNEPIIIDMVPRSKKERYYSDMTRTVMRGTPGEELKDMYSAVLDSQVAGINKIKAGCTGREIHEIVCDVLEERGYETIRGSGGITEGFIHSTGHGVGLDIHEDPSLGDSGKELKAGCVVTVEPGLYYKRIGGVRLEDILVVTKNGSKNLTMFEKNLVIK